MGDNFDVHIGALTSLAGLSPSRILCRLPVLPGSLPSPLSSWSPLGLSPKAKACTGVPALALFLEEPIWTLVRLLTFPLQVSMFPIFISDAVQQEATQRERGLFHFTVLVRVHHWWKSRQGLQTASQVTPPVRE